MTRATQTDPEAAPDASASSPPIELLAAGKSFARYQIVRCIGVGGMGAVFEATHTMLRKRVALKAMHASLGRSEASRARFLREAETVARVRHPNVVDITDVGVEQGIPFLVMEYLEGEDLANVLEREGKLSVLRTIDLVLPALAGLCAVHRLGIVHRDIKPENIFLAIDAYGEVVPKLVDFGVSKSLEAAGGTMPLQQHTVAGTPHYMSPEQARGSSVLDARTDQYAMGVLLYQCLSGVRPYDSESLLELIHMIDAGTCEPLRKHNPDVPEALESVIHRAMSRRIDDRFPSSAAFGQALLPFASDAVRIASAREFSTDRQSGVLAPPPRSDSALLDRLSANTLGSDDLPLGNVAVTVASQPVPNRSISGIRPRDSVVPTPAPSVTEGKAAAPVAKHKRAFAVAAALTAALLLALATWLLRDRPGAEPKQPVVVPSPTAPLPKVEPRPPEPPAQQVQPAPESEQPSLAEPAKTEPTPAPDKTTRRPKPKRSEPKDNVEPAPVDIQLSR